MSKRVPKAKVVSIVQRRLPHYRVPLFTCLRNRLEAEGITLRLVHGFGTAEERLKLDAGVVDWADVLPTTYVGRHVCWQPFASRVAGSELVILNHENALLANHLALFKRPAPKLAFWGHGANLQGKRESLRERYKRWSTRKVDWYFAYTRLSVDLVVDAGLPDSRVTQLNNCIDLQSLKDDLEEISDSSLLDLRGRFGLGPGPVGLFLGSLYENKRIDFLLEAAIRLRANIPDFQLLILGDGQERIKVNEFAAKYSWIRHAGARRGKDKASALKIASVLLNPGLVGLGILDSFVSGVPLVTTDCGLHSPEIAYLTPENGIMTADNLYLYVNAAARIITNDSERARIAAGCASAAKTYSLDNMVGNFSEGILRALEVRS